MKPVSYRRTLSPGLLGYQFPLGECFENGDISGGTSYMIAEMLRPTAGMLDHIWNQFNNLVDVATIKNNQNFQEALCR